MQGNTLNPTRVDFHEASTSENQTNIIALHKVRPENTNVRTETNVKDDI